MSAFSDGGSPTCRVASRLTPRYFRSDTRLSKATSTRSRKERSTRSRRGMAWRRFRFRAGQRLRAGDGTAATFTFITSPQRPAGGRWRPKTSSQWSQFLDRAHRRRNTARKLLRYAPPRNSLCPYFTCLCHSGWGARSQLGRCAILRALYGPRHPLAEDRGKVRRRK